MNTELADIEAFLAKTRRRVIQWLDDCEAEGLDTLHLQRKQAKGPSTPLHVPIDASRIPTRRALGLTAKTTSTLNGVPVLAVSETREERVRPCSKIQATKPNVKSTLPTRPQPQQMTAKSKQPTLTNGVPMTRQPHSFGYRGTRASGAHASKNTTRKQPLERLSDDAKLNESVAMFLNLDSYGK
ncbi:hypothetical protein BZG36_05415 [Bifiguratus adelaidae]|uniref:Uncharacterized protein n=1 Tax=Bifiguratus adelaidae TaxID=1938954 RepID=A0A261XTE7_9FUNG|nr:hypothetical protein BZG36_05415 [Bifiguratus adelaidae]